MSLPKNLSSRVLSRVVDRLRLTESEGPEGGPLLTFHSPMMPAPVGTMRVFRGAGLDKLVTVSLVAPAIAIDSYMIFAFTAASSAVPHFTLDAVHAGPSYAFHLDLIPRVDLGAELAYVNTAYQPITPAYLAAEKIPGLTPAQLSPRQRALMSPWMLAYRADAAAFEAIGRPVDEYLAHWLGLVGRGTADESVSAPAGARAARDRAHRAALFSPEIDPVWSQVDRLIGPATSAQVRAVLRGE